MSYNEDIDMDVRRKVMVQNDNGENIIDYDKITHITSFNKKIDDAKVLSMLTYSTDGMNGQKGWLIRPIKKGDWNIGFGDLKTITNSE